MAGASFVLSTVSFCLFLFGYAHGLAVMSVDIGTEWMKVAIVSPGVPMEIALNRESQRKTPVAVAFRDGERMFSDPAVTIAVRFPEKTFLYLLDVLGKKIDNPLVQLYKQRFPYYEIIGSESGGILFKHPEGMIFAPEELLAMVLKQGQEIAQQAAGQPIKDAVITVPPFFTHAERQAMMAAAQLSGINVLQMINSNTASALNYGVFRRRDFNETPTNIMFYDMGAGSTVATIVSYQLVKSKETNEVNPQLTVKGVGFDRTLGGLEMQLRLRDHFAKVFSSQKKSKQNIFKNNRAMAKLLKEAGRVKKVLSANTEHVAQVESLLEDIDFRCPITRAEFENMCSDLFDKVTYPVKDALKAANLEMDLIDQVILAGSGARVPKVQQMLMNFIKKPELGKSINTDESAALGAAYQAAHLSKGFKVKTFLVRDINMYPIQVEFQRTYALDDGTPAVKDVKRILFARNNIIPQKKVMTFNRLEDDFDFYVNYAELNFLNEHGIKMLGSLNISKVSVSNVGNAMKKHLGEKVEFKGIKAYFRLNESGLYSFENAESVFEKTVPTEIEPSKFEQTLTKLGDTIGRLFSGSPSTEEKNVSEVEKDTPKDTTADNKAAEEDKKVTASENVTKETETVKQDTNATTKESKLTIEKEPLTTIKFPLDLATLNEKEMEESIKKLQDLDKQDKEKLAKEKSKNSLESFIIETKDKLLTDEYLNAATEEEASNIKQLLETMGDWLEYESDDKTTPQEFQSKLSELRKAAHQLFERVKEHRERPEALKALNDMLNLSSVFLNGARNMSEEDQLFTEVEIKTLDKLITDTYQWLKTSVEKQAALSLNVPPAFTTRELSEKMASLDREVKYLLNKARFAAPLKKKKSAEKAAAANETAETTGTEETVQQAPANDSKAVPPIEMPEETEATVEETAQTASTQPVTEPPAPDKVKEGSHTEL